MSEDSKDYHVEIRPDGEARIKPEAPKPEDSLQGLKDTEEAVIKGSQPASSQQLPPWARKDAGDGLEVRFRDTDKPETFTENLAKQQRKAQVDRAKQQHAKAGLIPPKPFSSREEMIAAQADRRYRRDPAFRAEVIARIAVTPF